MPSSLVLSVIDAVRFVSGFSSKCAMVDKYNWSYIERRGKDEQRTDVVVFLHGFSSMKESWVRVARGIDKRYKIIIPDLPGHGRTTPIDTLTTYSISNQVQRLHAFLENELPPDKKIHLVGCSMGGMLAGVYAGLYPDHVKTLTLICPAGISMPRKSDLLKMLEGSGRNLLLAHTPEDVHELNRALSFKSMRLPNVVASAIASERKKQLPVLEKIIGDAMQDPTALEDLLPNIRAKTLVMWGKQDRVLDASSIEILQMKLSSETHGRFLLFDNCGHIVQHEKAAECTAAINKHLSDEAFSDNTSVADLPVPEKPVSSGKFQGLARSASLILPSFRLAAPSASKNSYNVQ